VQNIQYTDIDHGFGSTGKFHFEVFKIHVREYALDMWFEWLTDPKNRDFVGRIIFERINAFEEDLFDHVFFKCILI